MPDVPGSEQGATLQFLGAADTVTGSRYLITRGDRRILIDCGLFQGYKLLRDRNRRGFPVDPASLDAVVISHAHLDHSGYLPALVRDGFRGPVYATEGTTELSRLILPDSAHLLEEEARYADRGGWSKHAHPQPLYNAEDALRALERFRPLSFDTQTTVAGGWGVELVPVGHILGAASVRLTVGDITVHLSGDVGRPNDPLMRAPHSLAAADVLVVESTYGNRRHDPEDPELRLGDVVRRTVRRRGVVLIPAFAVGRTETLLLHLSRLRDRDQIPDVPIFVNSPMAASALDAYRRHPEEHRLEPAELERAYGRAQIVSSVDESKKLNLRGGPMIIISASGMLAGGRILHHLNAYATDPDNAIILTGFQAGGTRGAALRTGARSLRIFGRDVPVRAEVVSVDTMSAHADADELIAWMRTMRARPRQVYVTHGEPEAADTLRSRIQRELGWTARVPEHMETVELSQVHM